MLIYQSKNNLTETEIPPTIKKITFNSSISVF